VTNFFSVDGATSRDRCPEEEGTETVGNSHPSPLVQPGRDRCPEEEGTETKNLGVLPRGSTGRDRCPEEEGTETRSIYGLPRPPGLCRDRCPEEEGTETDVPRAVG